MSCRSAIPVMARIPARGSGPRRAAARSGVLLTLAALVALGGLLGGCLEEAADKDFKFDNPNDTTPENGGDDDTGLLAIAFVDDINDLVIVVNGGTKDEEMEGWIIDDDDATQQFVFPEFTLNRGQFVRAHTNDTSGTNDGDDVFATPSDTIIWSSDDVTATLRDADGNFVDQCDRGEDCWP